MKKSVRTAEQIIRILREAKTTGTSVEELCRQHNVGHTELLLPLALWDGKHRRAVQDLLDARQRQIIEINWRYATCHADALMREL